MVAVDIDVSNRGIPVTAPTKLFKDFDDDKVFNGVIDLVVDAEAVDVLEEEKAVVVSIPWFIEAFDG